MCNGSYSIEFCRKSLKHQQAIRIIILYMINIISARFHNDNNNIYVLKKKKMFFCEKVFLGMKGLKFARSDAFYLWRFCRRTLLLCAPGRFIPCFTWISASTAHGVDASWR